MGERARPICLLTRASEKPGTNSHLIRIMNVGAAAAAVALAEAVVVHTILFGLLFFLMSLSDDGQTSLHRPTGHMPHAGCSHYTVGGYLL